MDARPAEKKGTEAQYYNIPLFPEWVGRAALWISIAFMVLIAIWMAHDNGKTIGHVESELKNRQEAVAQEQDTKIRTSVERVRQDFEDSRKALDEKLGKAATKADLEAVRKDLQQVRRQIRSLTPMIVGNVEAKATPAQTPNKTVVLGNKGQVDTVDRTIQPCSLAKPKDDGWEVPHVMDDKTVVSLVLPISRVPEGVLVYDTFTHGKYVISPDCIWATYHQK